jgi:hypothetical protein
MLGSWAVARFATVSVTQSCFEMGGLFELLLEKVFVTGLAGIHANILGRLAARLCGNLILAGTSSVQDQWNDNEDRRDHRKELRTPERRSHHRILFSGNQSKSAPGIARFVRLLLRRNPVAI